MKKKSKDLKSFTESNNVFLKKGEVIDINHGYFTVMVTGLYNENFELIEKICEFCEIPCGLEWCTTKDVK